MPIKGALFDRKLWNLRLTTMADFFRQRFGPGVERFAALSMIPTSVLWAAAQVRAFGQVLASLGEHPKSGQLGTPQNRPVAHGVRDSWPLLQAG